MFEAVFSRAIAHETRGDWAAAADDYRTVAERGDPEWEFTAEAARLLRVVEKKLRDGGF